MAAPFRVKRWLPVARSLQWLWRRQLSVSACQHSVKEKRTLHFSSTVGVSQMPYYITTPIFYVNAAPHIGHLYTVLLADVAARWQRLKGSAVQFSVGTDEHGLKIQQAAEKAGASPKDYCDSVSQQFMTVFDQMNISYDNFVRTTQPAHYEAVHAFWDRLEQRGHIYKGSYEGWYCVSDEAFLTDDEVTDVTTPDGHTAKVSVSSGQPVSWMKEDNYMFRLTAFREQLLAWLDSAVVQPSQFQPVVRGWLDDLRDLSVSRQRQRLSWGIPVPRDHSQTVYVWLDALVNYLTVAGFPHTLTPDLWPPTCQVIGKDILRFHAVYWPAFLMAAGLPPPRTLLCHSHWMVDGHKMSKSRGNVVDPVTCSSRFTADGLRYFLLKEGSLSSDGNYNHVRAVERINGDLANSLGNLLSRVTAPSVNKHQEFPSLSDEVDLKKFLSKEDFDMYQSLRFLPDQADDLYQSFSFSRLTDLLMAHVHWANALVQTHQPWELVKAGEGEAESAQQQLRAVLHVAMETLRVCGVLLQPIVPDMADRLLTRLGVPLEERGLDDLRGKVIASQSRPLGDKVVLLDRIRMETK